MIRTPLILALALAVSPVEAGPWPRERGRTFLSATIERDAQGNRYTGLYGEYGLSSLTLGLEVGHASPDEASALVWAQRSLDNGKGPHRLSVSTGAGLVRREGRMLPVAQGALAWGRGFDSRAGGGWMSAQLLVRTVGGPVPPGYAQRTPGASSFRIAETTFKADLTLGLRPTERLMVVNSLWLEDRRQGDPTARLASSLVVAVHGPLQLEVGLVQPLAGPAERAIRLGSWISF